MGSNRRGKRPVSASRSLPNRNAAETVGIREPARAERPSGALIEPWPDSGCSAVGAGLRMYRLVIPQRRSAASSGSERRAAGRGRRERAEAEAGQVTPEELLISVGGRAVVQDETESAADVLEHPRPAAALSPAFSW